MENRIKINGEWYVREKESELVSGEDFDPVEYEGRVYESDICCFNACRLKSSEASVWIDFTDKTKPKPWKEDCIDNDLWMIAVLNGEAEGVAETFGERALVQFKTVVRDLIEVGWLKY